MNKNTILETKAPFTKKERKIFAAFEWNDKLKDMYKDIFKKISNDPKWKRRYGYKWKAQYGAEFTLPEDNNWKSKITLKDIEEFIYLNKQLYDVFVEGISKCDIFIADISGHNPNVMVELGIAVQRNKNILVVTNQNIKDMVFDIRGLHAFKYTSKKKLQELIEKHIEIYSEIKGQTFEESYISGMKYGPSMKGVLTNKEAVPVAGLPKKFKDLRIKVDFRFLYAANIELDWFGISLRTQGPWRYFSELTLIRYSGKTKSLTWPEKRKENEGKTINIQQNTWYTFDILIDENKLAAFIVDGKTKKKFIEDVAVIIEDFGEIWLACFDHHEPNFFEGKREGDKNTNGNYLEVEYKNVEILDLGTTANLYAIKDSNSI